MRFDFSSWPPELSEDQLQELTLEATTYALSHSLLYLPVSSTPPPVPTAAIHAPVSLFPAPFPRALFERVKRLQATYNVLYARIAMDTEFLDEIMGEGGGVADVDAFTRDLWGAWRNIRNQGLPEPIHLGIFRSDYLLHTPEASEDSPSLRQVEFNTISSSFGALSERVSGLHLHLLKSTNYFGVSGLLCEEKLPENKTIGCVAEGLEAAHRLYCSTFGVKTATILFVVQANERNVFDQRLIEYELLERHNILVIRRTMEQLIHSITIDASRALRLSNGSSEISVIYYRAGYTPTDYPSSEYYNLRQRLQSSRAINCPTIALQLAGGKKIQQVLSEPGVLERFLRPNLNSASSKKIEAENEIYTETDLADIRSTWMTMYGLGGGLNSSTATSTSAAPSPVDRALRDFKRLVLKPQREGGGNNVYKDSIPPFLAALPEAERAAWIAMELIEPPSGVGGYLVRAGSSVAAPAATAVATRSGSEEKGKTDVVSELGIFGWALFGGESGRRKNVVVNEEEKGGWLVRTKGRESDEGGVAVGFSVLDSVLLVD